MIQKIKFVIIVMGLLLNPALLFAICVENKTDLKLYYEIHNRNTGWPVPKERFHKGILQSHEKRCHAHSSAEGDDWKIYRDDLINIYRVDASGSHEHACTKNVLGIINTLEVSYHPWSTTWWCLDRSDYED